MIVSVAAVLFLSSVAVGVTSKPYNDVDIWIDPVQARELLCRGATLDIVREGHAQPIIQKLRNKLAIIPADIDSVNITWRAAPGYHYAIGARSSHTKMMTDLAISIPPSGIIPTSETMFQVKVPCTGRQSGLVSGRFTLKIWDADKQHIVASPLKIPFQKQCAKTVFPCHPPCENGARCADDGVCECPDGYYGTSCDHALCIPHCYNGGSCVAPNVCQCPDGFKGHRCQTAISCLDDCSNNGRCVAPDTCVCQHGWSGPTCAIRHHNRVKNGI